MKRRWSASSLLSLYLSISLCKSLLKHIGLLSQKKLVLIIKRFYPSWYKDKRRVIAVGNQIKGEKSQGWDM